MTETLQVYWNDDRIGRLTFTQGDFQFQYAVEWLECEKAAPISAQLPLQRNAFPDKSSRCFFANLLPEGTVRALIARQLGISEGNDFGLLKELGGDCAGALSLWPDALPEREPPSYESLPVEKLDAMIDAMAQAALMAPAEHQRLSLAGAQQKIPLLFENDRFSIPKGSAASTHIFKPDIPGFPHSALNEAFCMALAGMIGLPVPRSRLWRNRHTAFLVDRYDRRPMGHRQWNRLHQEDLCQALGFPHSVKYEAYGGPALKQAFEIMRAHSSRPYDDIQQLLRVIVFNACIGNMDAHAKNFSMLMDERAYQLAPFYDLLSTRAYPSLTPKLAMSIGGQLLVEELKSAHWEQLASEAGVAPRAVLEIVREITGTLPGVCPAVCKQFDPTPEENTMLNKLVRHITATCAGLARGLQKTS